LTVIVNGELTQLFESRCRVSRSDYFKRIYAKTASLFETAAASAAMISPVSKDVVEKMRLFGYNVGAAFQIVDDILDFTGEQATVGKPVGSDLRQGLITLPALCYLETHPEDQDTHYLLNGNCQDNHERIDRLVEAIRNSSAVQMAQEEAQQFIQNGLDILKKLPEQSELKALEELATYIVQRKA
jgi:geranylgeranyl pyrophosphate synthase